ncbi:helix-turn-helix domain-containing protein [Ruminococcaceae bacterium OttesenSCG-928-L11]|nr:helix-turn-helix domain-containing protein [Ruminococcaceae bacterium OttesenSCG-928-L11]
MNDYITSPSHEKRVYTVKEVAAMLDVSDRHAYNFCNSTTDFEVVKIGKSIRVKKDSFDRWFGN